MAVDPRSLKSFRVLIALTVLSMTSVLLRFVARWKSRSTFGADDYTIVIALLLVSALMTTSGILTFEGGLGKHATQLSDHEFIVFGKAEFALELLYLFTMTAAKVSVLLFYRRIFPVPSLRISTVVLGAITIAWCIGGSLVSILQCKPRAGAWDFSIPSTCLNPVPFSLAIAVTSMTTDIVILCIPLKTIWGLRLSTRSKMEISGIFLLGGLGCIASVLRIVTIRGLEHDDLPYTLVNPGSWSIIEAQLLITCACLPSLRPLLLAKTSISHIRDHISSPFSNFRKSNPTLRSTKLLEDNQEAKQSHSIGGMPTENSPELHHEICVSSGESSPGIPTMFQEEKLGYSPV